MQPWKKKKGIMRADRYVARFDPLEREVLGNLAATVAEALIARAQSAPKDPLAEMTGMPSGHKEAPADPRLARLLPDFEKPGCEEFDGDNALLRAFNESDIVRGKLQNLQAISTALGPDGGVDVTVEEDEAHAWLGGLNDIRLYLVAGDDYDPAVVEWLAVAQESLLDAMGMA